MIVESSSFEEMFIRNYVLLFISEIVLNINS